MEIFIIHTLDIVEVISTQSHLIHGDEVAKLSCVDMR